MCVYIYLLNHISIRQEHTHLPWPNFKAFEKQLGQGPFEAVNWLANPLTDYADADEK